MAEVTRVTQGGIQVLRSGNPKYRVTQGGIQVLMASPYPSQPILITPYDGFKAAETLVIQYTESVDPLGGGVTYYCRYKEDIDTVWTWIFQNRSGNDTYYHDISGDSDGDYEIELWAESASYSSGKATADFVIHNGMPTAPVITDPYEGQQWQKTTNRVEWEAATDPDEDPLTYEARYKKVSASSWTDLFDSVSNLYYDWNQTGFDVDDYELEVWANDGVGDGPADHVYFSIFIADEPIVPRIRIVEIGIDYVIAELEEYDHPQARAWQATKWELIPFGGDWSNPVVSYTTTDSSEQLQYTFTGLSPGFRGSVRATFQDNANTWGDPSTEAYFEIPGTTTDWERRWRGTHHG